MSTVKTTPRALYTIHSAVMAANAEADVCIVLISSAGETRVIPYWETDLTEEEFNRIAILESVRFVEEVGMGYVTSHVVNIREAREVLAAIS